MWYHQINFHYKDEYDTKEDTIKNILQYAKKAPFGMKCWTVKKIKPVYLAIFMLHSSEGIIQWVT